MEKYCAVPQYVAKINILSKQTKNESVYKIRPILNHLTLALIRPSILFITVHYTVPMAK